MTDEDIHATYQIIEAYYNKYLKPYGVKHVNLKDKNGNYTKDALVLIYLARNYPNTLPVSKNELTFFVRRFYPETPDVQQGRHLGKQNGYNILSGTRGNINSDIQPGYYKLVTLENPYPDYSPTRRTGIKASTFDIIKNKYKNKCAVCGSEEGRPHNFRTNEITKLQMGHMDPSLPLEEGNIIPQCQVCNRPDREKWIYDRFGRVIGVALTEDGKRIVEKYFKKASKNTREYFLDFIKKLNQRKK